MMETPDTTLLLAFFLCFYILLLSPISCFQIRIHKTAAFSIHSVSVDVCIAVCVFFFFLFVVGCISAPVAWKDLLRPYRVI